MTKPAISTDILFVSPEAMYPKIGGGALRTASIFEYLQRRHTVDVIAWREDNAPVRMPGVRELLILDLPHHSKHKLARAVRNLRRFANGRPPLLDRFSGFEQRIAEWIEGRSYEAVIVEHFWC